MIFLLFYYFAVSVCCAWAGLLGLRIFHRFIPETTITASHSMIMVLLSGLMLLTIGAEWLVLFFPLNPLMLIPLFALLHLLAWTGPAKIASPATGWISSAGRRGSSALFIVALMSFLLLVLVFNAGPSRMDDTDSYHIPSVKWMSEYGTVPGIANLHIRFGLNSAWFVAIALFTHSTKTLNNYLSLNGLLSVWFCFYLVTQLFLSAKHSRTSFNPGRALGIGAALLITAGNWYFLRRSAASCSYDFIGAVAIFVLFLETAENKNPPLEWLLWPLFLFTVRITQVAFLLLPLVFLIRHRSLLTGRILLFIGLLGGLTVIPFFIRNWLLSGYLFFPLTLADVLPGNWKSDAWLAARYTEYTRLFNRVNPMYQSMNQTRGLPGLSWVGPWWKYLFLEDKIAVTAAVTGYVFYWLRFRKREVGAAVFHLVMAVSVLAWFFIAPDPRFIQGVWLCGVTAGLGALKWKPKGEWRGFSLACLLGSLVLSGYALSKLIRVPECRNFILPRTLPLPAVTRVSTGTLTLNLPARIPDNWNARCYDVDLPCLYVPDPRLRLRGATLADGFRLDSAGATGSPSFRGEYLNY